MERKNETILRGRLLVGVFVVSLGTLAFEMLISRVMSVIAWYHFAFLAICMALLGMTLGALIVHRRRASPTLQSERFLHRCALLFAGGILLHLLIVCFVPPFTHLTTRAWSPTVHLFNLVLLFASIALPLTGTGMILSLVFARHTTGAGQIYFADLSGAAAGCLLFIPAINLLGVVNAHLLLAGAGLLAAFLFYPAASRARKRLLGGLALLLLVLLATNHRSEFLTLRWAKGSRDNTAFFKKWNSFSYVRLMDWGNRAPPLGWGFAPRRRAEIERLRAGQIYLDIDAMAGSVMADFTDRDFRRIEFLRYDITAMPYFLAAPGDVLIVGVGAGRDVLTALLFRQRHIIGVEFNGTILKILRDLLPEFSGDLARHPDVTLVHDEARSFLRSAGRTYDLIQLSLIDTFAATQAGAYALTENSLYTVEAFESYLRNLTDHGKISVSYWMQPGSPEAMLKLVGTATEALRRKGVERARDHLVVVHKDGADDGRGVANLLVRKTPFSPEELDRVRTYCEDMGFALILSPDGAVDAFEQMSDIRSFREFARNHPANIEPATDDRPFFFLLTRPAVRNFFRGIPSAEQGAEQILFPLFTVFLVLTAFLFFLSARKPRTAARPDASRFGHSLYFLAVGLAFMLVEMTQLTRLSAFLGHPIYGLAVVLFSFLLSSGLGSYGLGRRADRGPVLFGMVVFLGFCVLSGFFTVPILEFAGRFPIAVRVTVAAGLVFPLGFFMGVFLPQGIRIAGRRGGPTALYLGLNGAASVLGSVLAMIVQITQGLTRTFSLGVVLYLGAVVLFARFTSGPAGAEDPAATPADRRAGMEPGTRTA